MVFSSELTNRRQSIVERVFRVVASTLAAGALTYSVVHIGQQMLHVTYGKKYRILVPALLSATAASITTVAKAKEYGFVRTKKMPERYPA